MTMTGASASDLFGPVQLGAVQARNRIVLAPLTRLRSGNEGIPGDLLVEYYRQRASTGMIITEGTWPVREGRTWIGQPGIETASQQQGWARVADAVHAVGGSIAMQIMHGGRVSHPELTGTGRIVAPSATAGPNLIRIPHKADPPVADALTAEEIRLTIRQFVDAAKRAMDAGMDAVEIHGANGYLVHQFFSPAANHRTDVYGGSPRNRARYAIDLAEATVAAIGADRVGVRVSPAHLIQGMNETDADLTWETYSTFTEAMRPLGLGFLHVLHQDPSSALVRHLRQSAGAPLIANTGFGTPTTRSEAAWVVRGGFADAVSVGRALIANPDLVRRWRDDLPENTPDPSTFSTYYAGGPRGYTDYPALSDS